MRSSLFAFVILAVSACVTESEVPVDDGDVGDSADSVDGVDTHGVDAPDRGSLAQRVRRRFAERGIAPVPTPVIPGDPARRGALVALGQALVFDKILSDNRDISCMTCHPAALGSDDDRHLPLGVRGTGVGAARTGGILIPRNAPPLFNLHALDSLFWDGRVEQLADGSYRTPAGSQLTPAMTAVFELGALSAIGMFPVTNRDEMREHALDGHFDDLTRVPDGDLAGVWDALMVRLRAIPRYRELFADAYPSWPGTRATRIDTMTFAHASNAMAAFFADRFTSVDSPWDHFVAGDDDAFSMLEDLTAHEFQPVTASMVLRGADLFLRTCATCHNGPLLSDDRFHNTVLAQIGPGLGDGAGHDDFGRARVVAADGRDGRCGNPRSNASCRHAFRTPPLRNVLLTGPWGHAGQVARFRVTPGFMDEMRSDIEDLQDFVFHYASDVAANLRGYNADAIDPALRSTLVDNKEDIIAHADPMFVGDGDPEFHIASVDKFVLTAFLVAQTSESLLARGLASNSSTHYAACGVVPLTVPSGLPIDGAAPLPCQ